MGIKKNLYDTLLDELYHSDRGLLAISLLERYSMTANELFKFIDLYSEQGIIEVDDENHIMLTESGRNQLLQGNVHVSYLDSVKTLYNKIPINEPYLPNISFIKDLEGRRKETSN